MEIRRLQKTDDRLAVSRIYEESWKSAYRGIVPQDYLDSIPAGRWAPILDQAGWETLVIQAEDGKLVGTASLCPSRWPDYPDFGEVVSLYLLPESMRQGYGRSLLEAAVRMLAGRGFQDILLWVLEDNHGARSFYEKNGFLPGGTGMETVIGEKRLREILYLRHIG